ncbi:MAG: hypothetical protein ACK5BV_08850 [Bacteroidota bacterium]
MIFRKKNILFLVFTLMTISSIAQDVQVLLNKVKDKMNQVQDYMASGMMKTDVVFIKVPVAPIQSYYMKPDKFQFTRKTGVSLLPKGGVGINIGSLILNNDYTVVDAGENTWQGKKVKVAKLIPLSEASHIVLTTLYIDPVQVLISRVSTTTRENGTFELEMNYGKFASWGLPDKVLFYFNTKDYKLPKGITFEYDDGSISSQLPKNKKGKVEIVYKAYTINKGLGVRAFQK